MKITKEIEDKALTLGYGGLFATPETREIAFENSLEMLKREGVDTIIASTALMTLANRIVVDHASDLIEKERYHKAFDILGEYFECIPDEDQPKVSKQLTDLGL